MANNLLKLFRDIKAFVFDVDGVLTNGKVTLLPDGGRMRLMADKEGYALQHRAGIAACPSDAIPEIREICNYTSPISSGEGCARDIIERVMKIRMQWFNEDLIDNFNEFTW